MKGKCIRNQHSGNNPLPLFLPWVPIVRTRGKPVSDSINLFAGMNVFKQEVIAFQRRIEFVQHG